MVRVHLETFVRAKPEVVFDRARDLDLHMRSLADTRERIVSGKRGGLIDLGEEVEWEARHLGIRWRMCSRITALDRPRSFTDEQVRGPFATMRHVHTFRAERDGTMMIDDWEHRAPLGPLGGISDLVLRGHIEHILRARGQAIAAQAERT